MDQKICTEMAKRYPKLAPMLEIKFKPEGINSLSLLWRIGRPAGLVDFVEKIVVLAVLESKDWGGDRNRTILVRFPLGGAWTNSVFLECIAKDIESIRLATQHPLNVLMTGRKKVQEESASRIIQECIGKLNDADELPDYNLHITGELETVNGLPQLTFKLTSPDAIEATIVLDGWSGQIIVDGVPSQRAYDDPEVFHDIARNLALGYLEKVTA